MLWLSSNMADIKSINQPPLEIRPQPGFQEKVFGCKADIAIIGGSAGGGKTMALIVEVLKWTHLKDFAAVFFRRTMKQIRNTGGLLAESKKWYLEGELAESILKWRFPSGAEVDFEGIEYEKNLDDYMGAQIPLIVFDELTEFEERMFWFMISRNRAIIEWSDGGFNYAFKPYVRASCNPKPNSWVARLLEWWIDQDTGYPIPERDGVIRYMVNFKNTIYWGDTKDEVIAACPELFERMDKLDNSINKYDLIKSFTFIRGTLADNKILTRNSPEYYASLLSLSEEDQARYLDGNWKISNDGKDLFESMALQNIFQDAYYSQGTTKNRYIVIDAARYGQDLCTIYVFEGWVVIRITVFQLSSSQEVVDETELLRRDLNISRENIMVDQDGLGGDVVKLGGYQGFTARAPTVVVREKNVLTKENFKSFKDQCFFHAAEKVNSGECKIILLQSTTKLYERGTKKPRFSTKMKTFLNYKKKYGDCLIDLKVVIIDHLSCIKKGETVLDGGEKTYSINTKEEQKEILGGNNPISPDFADPICMRAAFDLKKKRRGTGKCY